MLCFVHILITLVSDVGVFIANKVQELESYPKEEPAQEVPQSSQIGYRRIIWVNLESPHPVYEPVGGVKEDPKLYQCSNKIDAYENWKKYQPYNVCCVLGVLF